MIERDSDASPPAPPKVEPESLVLRGRPRPVVRFRRGVIIGITAAVSAGVIGVTWLALEPASFRFAAEVGGESEPLRKASPEALANAPSNYGEVPRLGPPLPGDLGRPILEHQRRAEAPPAPAEADAAGGEADRQKASAEALRQRRAAELEAARRSPVGVQLTSRPSASDASMAEPAAAPAAETKGGTSAPAALPPGQQGRMDFARSEGGSRYKAGLEPSPSPWTLAAGTVIPASLVTGLNSDLPGMVFAQVTANVADSATGRTVLIPQGARLIGAYDSVVAYGQKRALLVWQRIVFPDGSSVALDNAPAADSAGYSGVADRVDFHTWRLLKGIGLSTMLGVGTQLGLGSGESDLVRAVREAAQQNAARAGDQITQRNLDVQPTIRVRPGFRLLAVIHKDLALQPWKG